MIATIYNTKSICRNRRRSCIENDSKINYLYTTSWTNCKILTVMRSSSGYMARSTIKGK